MRLSTIWSIPAMTLKERFRRTGEWLAMTTASKLPQRVRYWATLLEVAKATRTSPHMMAEPLDSILKQLDSGER